MTGKWFRCWIIGLSCSIVLLAGCAQQSARSNPGFLGWFRRAPLTEREQDRQEQQTANKKLHDPSNLHLKYAQWREHVGDLAEARESYQFALNENPKSLEAMIGLARLDQLAGRHAEAEEGFQKALKSRPKDPLAQDALGQFYASRKQWSDALPLLKEAADSAPDEPSYRYHLAVATAQSGDLAGAFAHFQQSVSEAEAHYNVGFILYEQGETAQAVRRFEQAVALNPNLKEAQTLLDELKPKPRETQLASGIAPAPQVLAPPIVRAAAVQAPPGGASVRTAHAEQWAARNPVSPMPRESVVVSRPAPPQPPTFQPTRQAVARQVEPTVEQQPSEFLPPYQPQTTVAPEFESPVTTTPAQREQWENQRKLQTQTSQRGA